ncbi:zinc-dependent metalloprotease [Occallatibacter riparius]|uniref:Zinc-dependent metalloprotease n=1 Tax=Occallatibacter riparius TaxID=1002689 RepID=A0A9J7BQ54_9BACT|nr:zinc-dependent metalloprotease [Occallatibacter riparius]UWZ84681.1 zinc-dependent metalloprotease [Occallatibacter riparius]
MSRFVRVLFAAAAVASAVASAPHAHAADATQSLSQKIAGMERKDGLFPLDWEAKAGKLYLEIPRFDQDFLLLDQLPHGMGSNDIGLDRGQLGRGHVVHFSRVGGKVLLIEPNLDFRSSATDPDERMAVTQSFAESVLWGFTVEAEENGRVLVDATNFFLRDAHGVAESLRATGQGAYRLDPSRSAIALENTKAFPKNTEVEAMLTFASEGLPKGEHVAEVTPDPHAITIREHTSMIELPDAGYKPRRFDPRAGYFGVSYRDYSVPVGEPLDQRFIARHRLEKKDPNAAISEPVKPIIYYVDRGAPEPIRSALVEGANWWAQAFEAAGFKNAFKVEVLPEGADPMDIRYNMIQWVHRYTRGWSYGEAVTDPRTGEIIKGQVTLGSLRSRQDYLIAEALLAPYIDGKPIPKDMEAMVLARTRQLAAHEVGHTLGLMHNFAASSIAQGTSVMDYPHPLITLDASGRPELSHAYATGIGAWDMAAIKYGYTQFAPGADEHAALDKLLRDDEAAGLRYMTDEDARPLGSAHPYAHLWDNGGSAPAELTRILQVRKAALARFSEDAIRPGTPMAQLEDTFVPLYLLHRYQTEAAAKSIGGLNYRYAVRGDGGMVTELLPPDQQRDALKAVLQTLSPENLTVPESLLKIFPPRPPEYPRTRESFGAHTGLTFDATGPVEAATNLTSSLLFNPARASRLIEDHARDESQPGLEEVLDAVLSATWKSPRQNSLAAQTQITVEHIVLNHLLGLAADNQASAEARGIARAKAVELKDWLATQRSNAAGDLTAHRSAGQAEIDRFLREPEKFAPAAELPTPPGQPIGDDLGDASLE